MMKENIEIYQDAAVGIPSIRRAVDRIAGLAFQSDVVRIAPSYSNLDIIPVETDLAISEGAEQ